MTILREFAECDGWAIIGRMDDGTVHRLHAAKRPKDSLRFVADAEKGILSARAAEAEAPIRAREDAKALVVEDLRVRLSQAGTAQERDRVQTAIDVLTTARAR